MWSLRSCDQLIMFLTIEIVECIQSFTDILSFHHVNDGTPLPSGIMYVLVKQIILEEQRAYIPPTK